MHAGNCIQIVARSFSCTLQAYVILSYCQDPHNQIIKETSSDFLSTKAACLSVVSVSSNPSKCLLQSSTCKNSFEKTSDLVWIAAAKLGMLQKLFVTCRFSLSLSAELKPLLSDRLNSHLEQTVPKCGWVVWNVLPCQPCTEAPLPWLARFWELPPDQDRLPVHYAGICRQCSFVVSTHCGRRLSPWLASLWDMPRLWRRRGWWRWSGKVEATVCTPSSGCGTTASARCARWSRHRRANCWCLTLMSTQELTPWTSPMTAR